MQNRGEWTLFELTALNRHEGVEQPLVIHKSSKPKTFMSFNGLFSRVIHIIYFDNFDREGLGGARVYIGSGHR
jgi:hypothetical protein